MDATTQGMTEEMLEAGRRAFELGNEGVVRDDEKRCGADGVLLLCKMSGSAKSPRWRPYQCPENVRRILEGDSRLSGVWAYDSMAHRRIITRRPPWDAPGGAYPRPERDDDYSGLACFINSEYNLLCHRDIMAGVARSARDHEVNALHDYLAARRGAWDGTPRIDTMLHDCLGVADDTDAEGRSYVATATLLWLRGAIHRALDAGNTKFDCVLILSGPQGCGKTTFFSRLAHRPEWLCENLEDIGNDARCFEQASSCWLVCLDELVAMKKLRESTKLKSYITREADQYRAPYARVMETLPRHYVFCGTTNEAEFLTDPTGARRFLVATCGAVEPVVDMWDAAFGDYIDQIWSEALARDEEAMREAGGKLELMLPEWAVRAQAMDNEARQQDDGTRGMFEAWLEEAHRRGELVFPSRVIREVLGMSQEDLARAPYKSRMMQEVSSMLQASPDWEPGGRQRDVIEDARGEITDWGRQRVYIPVRRDGEAPRDAGGEAGASRDDEFAELDLSALDLFMV